LQVVQAIRSERGEEVVLRLDRGTAEAEDLAELAVLAAVEHPGIAGLVDHGALSGGGRFLARAWIGGVDLLAWAEGRPPEEIGRLIARLTPALEHLHRLGFVHADLKPENVIVTRKDQPVLCDFGLSRRGGSTQDAGVSGTLFAIAPEVLLGNPVSPAADLFALGAMLHRLLVGQRTSAREFYARFPQRSFLDAAGSSPEELPPWARDLVVGLTTRDPARRPKSAASVGRTLAERLGIEVELGDAAEELHWPVGFARESWLDAWYQGFRETEEDDERPEWIRVPESEDPRPLWNHLRLFASLRGQTSLGVELEAELDSITTTAGLDAWARELADRAPARVVACVRTLDPWRVRGIEVLARALRLVRAREPEEGEPTAGEPAAPSRPRLHVVASGPPPAGGESDVDWRPETVPPIDVTAIERFLSIHLADDPDRRKSFAEGLHAAAKGSATCLERLVVAAQKGGRILPFEERYRLRPGPVPEVVSEGAAFRVDDALSPGARTAAEALAVVGSPLPPEELRELTGQDERSFARALLELSTARMVQISHGGSGTELGPRLRIEPGADRREALATLHAARARQLFARTPPDSRAWVHAFCADPSTENRLALVERLAKLRDEGGAEIAIELVERLERLVEPLGIVLERDAPDVLIEYAYAWYGIGQAEHARSVTERLEPAGDAKVAAQIELVRARIAALQHDTDEAIEHCERAVALDPEAAVEADVRRIHILNSMGRDQEVCDAVERLRPRERLAAGEIQQRTCAYAESLQAMSSFRLGRVDEALVLIRKLIEEARALENPGLEAPFRITKSIFERRAGSLQRAREDLEASVDLYDRSGHVAGLAHARSTLGGILRDLGELVQAEPLLTSAVEIRERLGDVEGATTVRGMLGLLYYERGHARAAIEALMASASALHGAQRRRHAPILYTKAAEMRTRVGQSELDVEGFDPGDEEDADPRILLSKARSAWMVGEVDEAREFAARAATLATSLKLTRLAEEASLVGAWIDERPEAAGPLEPGSLAAEDARIYELLDAKTDEFRSEEARTLAEDLATRGRDDRAARLFFGIAARTSDGQEAQLHLDRAQALFRSCAAGLTKTEEEAYRNRLLGIPDPWMGDFTPRPDPAHQEKDFEMEVVSLLDDINRQLVQQQNLDTLLGAIVDSALHVTGAERGFLVLEERGRIRFDTALDSLRGDIPQPELEVSRSVVREALDKMQPVRLSNAVDDPLLGHTHSVVSLELRSILCIPFEIAPGLRGAIYVDHRLRTGAFDERAERLCTMLATQAALAIQQMQRIEEIRHLNEELEHRVVQQETDLRSARHALREAGLSAPVGGLIGESPAMSEIHDLLERAAPSDIPILITGASGTGKELAALSIHQLSNRRNGVYISENCATLPPSLIESELFGHKKGAFTGADRDRAGVFERANDGTLFLDEIGEIPLDLQAKLLRVLEMSEVRRIGDSAPRKVDFRLVVATNRDLEREVREGRFREDLFFRLDGLRVKMPTLEERTEDIPMLVDHFLHMEAEKANARIRKVSKAVMTRLCRRLWPGNVRELKNEIARLCVLSEGDIDDPGLVREPVSTLSTQPDDRPVTLAELEKKAILETLERTRGDKRRAAELLGISRAKIYQRLKEWDDHTSGSSRPARTS